MGSEIRLRRLTIVVMLVLCACACAIPGLAFGADDSQAASTFFSTSPANAYSVKQGSDGLVAAEGDALKAGGKADTTDANKAPTTLVSVRSSLYKKTLSNWKSAKPGKNATTGSVKGNKSIQTFAVKLESDLQGSIQYQAYVRGEGWQELKEDGQIAGLESDKKVIEGVRIALVGDISKSYSVAYRVRIAGNGWTSWEKDGAYAGKKSKKVGAIQVRLVTKKEATEESDGIVGIMYSTNLKGVGTQVSRANGNTSGNTKGSAPIRALKVWLCNGKYDGSVKYRAYDSKTGWTTWQQNGKAAGKGKQGHPLEAVQIRLTGEIAKVYDVQYRTYVLNSGWQQWVFNGGKTGFTGKGNEVTAIQVKLVKKGSVECSVKDGTYVIMPGNQVGRQIGLKGESLKRFNLNADWQAGKFYVRNERDGISLQSVSTGKFIAAGSNNSLKLVEWSKSNELVWGLTWDGGIQLVNQETGARLALSGKNVKLKSKGTGFLFKKTNLLQGGTFKLTNAGRSSALTVTGSVWDSGGNIRLAGSYDCGEQVFDMTCKSNGMVTLTNVMSRKPIAVENGSSKQGANVIQVDADQVKKAQQWEPGLNRDGSIFFKNRASGKVLAAKKGGAQANVVSAKYTGTASQGWWLSPASWEFTGDPSLDRYIMEIVDYCGGSLWECFDWMGNLYHVQSVDSRIYWGLMEDWVSLSYVEIARDRGVADCYTDAGLFCWLARGCGYDAEMRAGGCPSASGGTVPHGWTEVYIDGTTYVCDPNLRRDLPGYNWYLITYDSAPVAYTL